jgi:long-chain fatty acid transport protein
MKKILTIIGAVLIFSINSFSAGFQLNEHSASAMGMGNAYTAHVNDASAIYFNPGALGFLEGEFLTGGVTFVYPQFTWTSLDGSQTVDAKDKLHPIPSFYYTKQISDRVTVGFGSFTPYGLETDWPTGWPGTQLADRTKIQTFYLSPTVGIKLTDNFSIGFQANFVVGNVLIKKKIGFVDSFGDIEMSGDDMSWGGSFGFMWKVNDKFNIGGTWRSSVNLRFEGEVDFDNIPTPFLPLLYDGDIYSSIELPQTWTIAFSYQCTDKLLVAFDFFHTDWSSYDNLVVYRADDTVMSSVLKEWDNVNQYRIGIKYLLSDKYTIYGGYIYDETPAPDHTADPSLPDASRNDFTAGIDYKMKDNLTLTVSGMWVRSNDRTVTEHYEGFYGLYEAQAFLLSFGVNYQF